MSFEIRKVLGSVMERVVASDRRYRARRQFMEMDQHILDDIGISRRQLLDGARPVAPRQEAGKSRPVTVRVRQTQ